MNIGILTISDKGSRGERVDESGKVIREIVSGFDCPVLKYDIVPDEVRDISSKLREWADSGEVDVILTTGGTGLSPRDVTPEATLSVIDKVVPGFGETMRLKSLDSTPTAILSRATAGVRKRTLIINLPGSPKAVRECLDAVWKAIPHAVEIIKGEASECATRDLGRT